MPRRLSATQLLLLGLAVMDVALISAMLTHAWPLQILALILLLIIPGATLAITLKLETSNKTEALLYVIGLGLLVLMGCGLLTNQLFFALGDEHPLQAAAIFGVLNVCIVAGICLARLRPQKIFIFAPRFMLPSPSKSAWLVIGLATILPCIATAGAFRLNNGANEVIAQIAIGWALLVVLLVFWLRRHLSDAALAWTLGIVGFSILLMTALRSWDIAGHDIMREFHVYTLTMLQQQWDIGLYRDPYNACLSITILPVVIAKLTGLSGLVIFKAILPGLFALCIVALYVLLRRFTGPFASLCGCTLFICYPTFINDSAMLTRQGVAYLFFTLALLVILQQRQQPVRKSLFMLLVLGMIISHYSTSYMFVAVFGGALVLKLAVLLIRRQPIEWWNSRYTVLTPAMGIFIFAATAIWYGPVTATSNGLSKTIASSVSGLPTMLSADNKSSDTSVALFLSSQKTQIDIYQSYITMSTGASPAITRAAEYTPQITSDNIPVTKLGRWLITTAGIRPDITASWRQGFAKVLQLVALLSVGYAMYVCVTHVAYSLRRKARRNKNQQLFTTDMMCLSLAGMAVLLCMVVLPMLSVNYGVLRTFQQLLLFLIVPIIITLRHLVGFIKPRLRYGIAITSLAGLFLLFTGFIAQLLGSVSAPLTLNNYGLYYGLYYTTKADLAGYAWIKEHVPLKADVRAASYLRAKMHDPDYPFSRVGILPTQVSTESYVYMDHGQMLADKLYINHDGSPLILSYPRNYFDDWSNRIYSNGTAGVYH